MTTLRSRSLARLWATVIAVAGTALVTSCGPSLPVSDKMSDNFKKAAYDHWLSYHQVGVCVLPTEVKPENTTDQQVRELFDQCSDYDVKKMAFVGKMSTDDLKRQYNDLNDQQKDVKRQIDAIFRANGYDDPDAILKKQREEQVKGKKK